MSDHNNDDLGDKARDVAQDIRDKSHEAIGRVKEKWDQATDDDGKSDSNE